MYVLSSQNKVLCETKSLYSNMWLHTMYTLNAMLILSNHYQTTVHTTVGFTKFSVKEHFTDCILFLLKMLFIILESNHLEVS